MMLSGHQRFDRLVLAAMWVSFTGSAVVQVFADKMEPGTAVLIGAGLFLAIYVCFMPPLLRLTLIRMMLVFVPALVLGAVAVFFVLTEVSDQESKQRVYPALVTGTVIVLGWFVTYLSTTFREAETRDRARRDALVALKHEIFALVDKLDNQAIAANAERVQAHILAGDGTDAESQPVEYLPFSTMESEPLVFEAIAPTIPALEEDTVGPVVRFYAEYTDLRRMVEDSRSAQIHSLPRDRRVGFHQQLTKRRQSTLRWGLKALVAINESLGDPHPKNIERSGQNPEILP